MKNPGLILLLLCAIACHKDKRSEFEKRFVGSWDSVSYIVGATDHSADFRSGITFQENADFVFHYQWQDDPFSYVIDYEQEGSWSEDESATKITLNTNGSKWTQLSAFLSAGDSLHLTGLLGGADAEIIFTRR